MHLTSPELTFWFGLALKMAMTAGIVVAVSVVVERSGPFLGALIAALPTAAGAAYIILAAEHPPSFIAASALGSIASVPTVSIFALTYTLLAQRHGLLISLGLALLAWSAAAALLRLVGWTTLGAVAFNAAVFAIAVPLSWRYRTVGRPPKFLRTAFDIPLRALTAALVVVAVTAASDRIGSFASGLFALFPIVICCSIVILHPRVGGKASASVFGARADRLPRTHIRLPRRAFSRRTARSMVGAFARPCRFRRLERAALAPARASYFAFASCALSA